MDNGQYDDADIIRNNLQYAHYDVQRWLQHYHYVHCIILFDYYDV